MKMAGSRQRQPNTEPVAEPTAEAAQELEPRQSHPGAQYAAARLAVMAQTCETFFIVLTFLGYVGAAIEIALGIQNHFTVVPGVALAVGLTASLLPILLLCRWAQAYAVDLEMRA
jgi:hypothetical protein